ncbi:MULTISPECIES: hypothetical protein [Pseudomonas]|uniref:hypothetical protein n=1 Tax=Pseudomonas TaxID=286 RepID=UPI000509AF00|nr:MULTISPECIES: hypothetical protein [Pseudomonas]RMT88196.1 hypothetical protein ALP41_03378 [Pseudomonas savastanoi pv. nerii]
MRAQQIMILNGLVICFSLPTFFIERAIKQALDRSYQAGKSIGMSVIEVMENASIHQAVEWSRTALGGIQYDLIIATDATACPSAYGLFEFKWQPITAMEAI